MIRYLTLRNFRAFRAQRFDFARMNIFVGPNNSGKSSALSALNIIAQTLNNPTLDAGPIVLNGQFDQLGTFKDVVHGGRSNTPISFEFGYDDFNVQFELKFRQQRRETELSKFKLQSGDKNIFEYNLGKDRYDILALGRPFEDLFEGERKFRPRFHGFWPVFPLSLIAHRESDRQSPTSERNIDQIRRVDTSLRRARSRLNGIVAGYDSLSPFRAQPQRTYLYSGESASHIGQNGENTILMLSADSAKRGSERQGYVEEISRWLKATDIALGLRVKTLTPRHFELCVVGKDGTEHNICDVGFGCSQVLPVLVAGLQHSSRMRGQAQPFILPTLVVQEPEIHLHPNAQASLGSFFASLLSTRGQIFLETHSDNLVLRIARHIALGEVDPEDVKIFYVSDERGTKVVTEMRIASDGSFLPDWPGGFFPQREVETFQLAKASMRKSRGDRPAQLTFRYLESGE